MSLLYTIFKKLFKKELAADADTQFTRRYQEEKLRNLRFALKFDYPVGQKVIVRSNEPGPLFIGEVVGYRDFGPTRELMLEIKDCFSDRVIISMNNRPPYWTEERESALNKLNWAEQWNVLSLYHYIDEDHKLAREKAHHLN